MEAEPSGETLRSVRLDGDSVPLPARLLEVEPGRTPTVQPDQQQLGRKATQDAGDNAGLHPRDNDDDRANGESTSRRGDLQERAEGDAGRHGTAQPGGAYGLFGLELHDQ